MRKIVDGYVEFSVNGECENLGAYITDDSNLDYDVEEDEDEDE